MNVCGVVPHLYHWDVSRLRVDGKQGPDRAPHTPSIDRTCGRRRWGGSGRCFRCASFSLRRPAGCQSVSQSVSHPGPFPLSIDLPTPTPTLTTPPIPFSHLDRRPQKQAQEALRGAKALLEPALRAKEQLGDADGHALCKALARAAVANGVALAQAERALQQAGGEQAGGEARVRVGMAWTARKQLPVLSASMVAGAAGAVAAEGKGGR